MKHCTITLEAEIVIRACEAIPAHVKMHRENLIDKQLKLLSGKFDYNRGFLPRKIRTREDAVKYMEKHPYYHWAILEAGGDPLRHSRTILDVLRKTKASTISLDVETIKCLFAYE